MEKARRVLTILYIVAIVAAFALLMAMGIEISGHMNPDVLLPEAYALGGCWIVMTAYFVFNLIEKRKN